MRRDVIAAVRNAVGFCYQGSLGLLYTRLGFGLRDVVVRWYWGHDAKLHMYDVCLCGSASPLLLLARTKRSRRPRPIR